MQKTELKPLNPDSLNAVVLVHTKLTEALRKAGMAREINGDRSHNLHCDPLQDPSLLGQALQILAQEGICFAQQVPVQEQAGTANGIKPEDAAKALGAVDTSDMLYQQTKSGKDPNIDGEIAKIAKQRDHAYAMLKSADERMVIAKQALEDIADCNKYGPIPAQEMIATLEGGAQQALVAIRRKEVLEGNEDD